MSIPVAPPPQDEYGISFSANDGSPGDLDGDGQYDIVLKWDPIAPLTDSAVPMRSHVFLDGYTLAGKQLWRIDLGPNIPASPHFTQFSVYDFDGDGKAEVACKTAPGTKDGTGAYLGTGPAANDDDSVEYMNSAGSVLAGPEYLTVFDGATGKELATVDYPVPRGTVCDWGDCLGNRMERYNGGMAFVSDLGTGKTATGRPSIIQQRGYYTRLTVFAYNWRDGQLTKTWLFDSNTPGNTAAAGQGCLGHGGGYRQRWRAGDHHGPPHHRQRRNLPMHDRTRPWRCHARRRAGRGQRAVGISGPRGARGARLPRRRHLQALLQRHGRRGQWSWRRRLRQSGRHHGRNLFEWHG